MSSRFRYRSPAREEAGRRYRGSSRSRTPPRRNNRDRDYSIERESGGSRGAGGSSRSNYRDRDTRGFASSQPGSGGNSSRNERDRRDRRDSDTSTQRRGADGDDRRYYSPAAIATKQESGGTGRSSDRGRRFQSPEPGYERDASDRRGPRPGIAGGRRGPRQTPVDHSTVPPFMLRVLVKHGDWHEEKDFNTKDGSFEKMCENDEIQVYAWIDSNLRTVVELTQDVRDEDRNPQHSFHMRIVKFDESMKPSFVTLPTVHATYRAREDNISLGEKSFVVGDLIDICVTRGKYSQPGVPVNAASGGTLASGAGVEGEAGGAGDVPMMKEERNRSESDLEANTAEENIRRSDEAENEL